jgi:hypothetical protein
VNYITGKPHIIICETDNNKNTYLRYSSNYKKMLNYLKKIKIEPMRLLNYVRASTFLFCLLFVVSLNAQDNISALLHGAYFGQTPPGKEPVVFAKNIISTDLYEHSAPAFSPNGKIVLWTVVERDKPARLLEMVMEGDTWSKPHSPSFADKEHDDFYPFFSYDGKRLLFSSRRLLPSGSPKDIALWVVEHTATGWGIPVPLDSSVSRGFEYAHSLSVSGNLYFSGRDVVDGKGTWKIYAASFINGIYKAPKPLDSNINDGSYVDGPYISADENFLIFESDRAGGMGSIDLYICFKKSDGKWSAPKNMGPKINSTAAERFAG